MLICILADDPDPSKCGTGLTTCMLPMNIEIIGRTNKRGFVYYRHTTAEEDLKRLRNYVCRNYTDAFIITYSCIGSTTTVNKTKEIL